MNGRVFRPNSEPQARFFASRALEILLSSGFGKGKTRVLCEKADLLCRQLAPAIETLRCKRSLGERCANSAAGIAAVDGFDPQSGLDRACRRRERLRGVRQVGLGENHDRVHPHLASQHQIAFQPRDAEILVAGGDDKECIDVRGDHLLFASIGR